MATTTIPTHESLQNERGTPNPWPMGRIRVDTMSQVARHDYLVKAICRCGNWKLFDPLKLALRYRVRTMDELHKRFRCGLCGQRPWDIQVAFKEVE